MTTSSGHNPFQPPNSNVTVDAQHSHDDWINGGQTVPAGNALNWIGEGWTLFAKSPGIWILNMIIMFVLSIIVTFIPFIGSLASNLLVPVVIGGVLLGCRSLEEGGELRVDHLFAGFKDKASQLILIGLLTLAVTVVIVIALVVAVIVMFGASILQAAGSQQAMAQLLTEQGLMMFALFMLVLLALMVPLMMAYWFAPALVVFRDMDAVSAMKQSFQGCLRNMWPFLLYGVVFLVLGVVALIPVGLGLFVIVPMAYGSLYASFKDIYLQK